MAGATEDIMWDDDDGVTSDSSILAIPVSSYDIIVGSRFEGVNVDDIPEW
jgi:hypothetical protein